MRNVQERVSPVNNEALKVVSQKIIGIEEVSSAENHQIQSTSYDNVISISHW